MAFDTHAGFVGSVRRTDGKHPVHVRWPSDEEWHQRQQSLRIVIQQLGRGRSQTDSDTAQADLELYQKIREENAPDLEADEAKTVVGFLARCDITGVQMGMEEAEVEMTVTNGLQVKHVLRVPTTAEVTQWQRASHKATGLPHNRNLIRISMQPGAELWAKCHRSHEGYVNGVPVNHQDAAIRAVIDACENDAGAGRDEDF